MYPTNVNALFHFVRKSKAIRERILLLCAKALTSWNAEVLLPVKIFVFQIAPFENTEVMCKIGNVLKRHTSFKKRISSSDKCHSLQRCEQKQ